MRRRPDALALKLAPRESRRLVSFGSAGLRAGSRPDFSTKKWNRHGGRRSEKKVGAYPIRFEDPIDAKRFP